MTAPVRGVNAPTDDLYKRAVQSMGNILTFGQRTFAPQQQSTSMLSSAVTPGETFRPTTGQLGQAAALNRNDVLSSKDTQLAQYARAGGFSQEDVPMALSIIKAESGGNPTAINRANRNGTTDTGLFQINSVHSAWTKGMDLNDPVQNAKAAYKIYTDAGKKWTPWSTYNNGAYQRFYHASQPTISRTANGSVRSTIVDKAMAVAASNVPYVWSGNSLSKGVDCSGLVQQIYGSMGIALPRTADAQSKTALGQRTTINNLKPGDLVAWQGGWRGPNYVGHIAIYAGNGQIVEAPHAGANVRRRVLKPNENVFGVQLRFNGE